MFILPRATPANITRCFSTLPPVELYAVIDQQDWVKKISDAVFNFFDSTAVREVVTSPLSFTTKEAKKNLLILEKAGGNPTQTCWVKDESGNTELTPFYGQVTLQDADSTVSLVDSVARAGYFPYRNDEDAKLHPEMEDLLAGLSFSVKLKKRQKLADDSDSLSIQWPQQMVAKIHHQDKYAFAVISETVPALDEHDMRLYLQQMTTQKVLNYARSVLNFTVLTNCLNPDIRTLPIQPGKEDTVIVKNFNYSLGTAAAAYDPNSLFPAIFGLKRAIELGELQKLPAPYLNLLFDGYKHLCKLSREAQGS